MKKRNWRTILIVILAFVMVCSMQSMITYAASGSVSVSGATGEVGNTVNVSVTVKASKAINGATLTFGYDPTMLKYISGGSSGGSGSVVYFYDGLDANKKSISFTIKFKIKKEGESLVECTAADVIYGKANETWQMTMTKGSATIKGNVTEKVEPVEPTEPKDPIEEPKPNKKSSNTKLTSLKVYPGSLSPAFSSDVRKYTMEVGTDVEEITVSASTQSDKATFYVSGNEGLKEGKNTVKVVVTAEDGTVNSYVITVKKLAEEKELTIVEVNGETFTIQEKFKEKDIPDGFKTTKIMYDDAAYEGVVSADGTMELLCLKDVEGEEAFYVYMKEVKSFYPFVRVQISKEKSIILQLRNPDKAPENMAETTFMLEGFMWNVWGDESGEFCVVNALGSDGEEMLYRYDMKDGTYQRYTEPAPVVEKDETKIDSILPQQVAAYYDYILIAAVGLIAILLVVIFALAANAEKRRRKRREKIEKWKERRG